MRRHSNYERKELGERLRQCRRLLGLTQAELASSAGLTQASVSHYESGKIEIRLGALVALARALGIPATALAPELGEAPDVPAYERRPTLTGQEPA